MGNKPNYVVTVTIEVGLPGWEPFYHIEQEQAAQKVSSSIFADVIDVFPSVLPDDAGNTQLIDLPTYSDRVFRPTPPSLGTLTDTLRNASLASESTLNLEFRYEFVRQGPDENKVVAGKNSFALSPEQAGQFHDLLTSNNT